MKLKSQETRKIEAKGILKFSNDYQKKSQIQKKAKTEHNLNHKGSSKNTREHYLTHYEGEKDMAIQPNSTLQNDFSNDYQKKAKTGNDLNPRHSGAASAGEFDKGGKEGKGHKNDNCTKGKNPFGARYEAHKNVIRLNITQFELTKILYSNGILGGLDITPSAKLFLWALCSHFNPENDSMFPSQQTVAKKLGISEKTAQRAVKELKNAGLITYETKRVNHYIFGEKFFELVKMSCTSGQNVLREVGQNVPLTKNTEKRKNNHFAFDFENKTAKKQAKRPDMPQKTRMVPDADETRKMLDEHKKAGITAFNPYECTKKQAKEWLKAMPNFWLPRSKMAKYLVEKFNIVEFQHILKNEFNKTPGALQNLTNAEKSQTESLLGDFNNDFSRHIEVYNEAIECCRALAPDSHIHQDGNSLR